MVRKLLICVTALLLSIECIALYVGQSCSAEGQDGSCQLLPECQPLMAEIQQAGSPIPRHLSKRLNALNCGFQESQPLVCCPALTNVNNRNPATRPPSHTTTGAPGTDDRMDDTNRPTRPRPIWGGSNPMEGSSHIRPNSNTNVPDWEIPQTENPWNSNTNQNPSTWGASGNKENNDNVIFNANDKKWNTHDDDTGNDRSTPPDIRGHRNLWLLPKKCGTIEDDRIIGGNRTNLFEMPWMVLISYDSPRGRKLSCGGTLITKWYVLTAAHCVTSLGAKLSLSGVVLGEHDIRNDPDCEWIEGERTCAPNARNVTVETVIAHPGYSPQNLFDDIALLRLSEPADFSLANMMPICLPTTTELQSENLVNDNAVVAGWGATEDGLLQSPVLLNVKLPVISNEDCQAYFKGSPRIYPKQLCAGGVGHQDSCGGDSGGPLMYPGQVGDAGVSYVQRGIVSFGSKRCGVEGYPGIYTRVAFYMDWILDNIND